MCIFFGGYCAHLCFYVGVFVQAFRLQNWGCRRAPASPLWAPRGMLIGASGAIYATRTEAQTSTRCAHKTHRQHTNNTHFVRSMTHATQTHGTCDARAPYATLTTHTVHDDTPHSKHTTHKTHRASHHNHNAQTTHAAHTPNAPNTPNRPSTLHINLATKGIMHNSK